MSNAAIVWGYRFGTQPDVQVTAGVTSETLTLQTSPGTDYFVTGDGQADDLIRLLEEAIESHSAVTAISSSLTAARKTFLDGSGINLQLEWTDGNTTLDPTIFGWTAVDTGLAATLTSPYQVGGLWLPGAPPMIDTRSRRPVIGGVAMTLQGDIRVSNFGQAYKARELYWHLLPETVALVEYAPAGAPLSTFETAWLSSMSLGYAFRYYPDEADITSGAGYTTLRISDLTEPLRRDERYLKRWAVNFRAREVA